MVNTCLELMNDMIILKLSKREEQIFVMSTRAKNKYIAKELGIKPETVTRIKSRIKKKVKNHEEWLRKSMELRGV